MFEIPGRFNLLPSNVHPGLMSVERGAQLLIAAPNRLTHDRIRAMLAWGAVGSTETDLGLRVECGQVPWPRMLESLSLALTPMERHDTRVAIVPADVDELTRRHAIFSAGSFQSILDESSYLWVADLVAEGRIRIEVQPVIQHPPGRVHGYEFLMRGVDIDGSAIPPGKVFAAAGKLGLTTALESKCRGAAIARAGEIFAAGGDESLSFFINFVPSAVQEPMTTLRQVAAQVESAGLRPQQITFEVVETDRIDTTRRLMSVLQYFRKAGFKVALDDVGAGYASLMSLSSLRPDYIKIEGELVRRGAHSSLEQKLVKDLAETARQNGLMVIAEGIETDLELRMAHECGIRLTQGYFHARPSPRALSPIEVAEIVRGIEKARAVRLVESDETAAQSAA